MLTREECLNALETLCTYADCYPSSSGEFVGKMLQEADDTLQELIEEYFDNQALKFEELKENIWVWDNKTKSYIFIFKPLNWEPTKGIRYANMIIYHSAEGYYMDFEENRFYRREVKDDQ